MALSEENTPSTAPFFCRLVPDHFCLVGQWNMKGYVERRQDFLGSSLGR